jgi:hypothetical protein
MEFAPPLDHDPAVLVFNGDAEGRVLNGKARQRLAHLLLVAFGLWLDGDLY